MIEKKKQGNKLKMSRIPIRRVGIHETMMFWIAETILFPQLVHPPRITPN